MKTLYLDVFSGISGDMFLGAMLDLGLPKMALEAELSKLKLDEYRLKISREKRSQVEGIQFEVCMIDGSNLKKDNSKKGKVQHDHHEHHKVQKVHKPHDHEHHKVQNDHQHHKDHNDHHHSHGRDFSQIKDRIRTSQLSDWVKKNAIETFARIARAEGKIHGKPADKVHFHEVGAVDSIVDIVGACIALEWLKKPKVLASNIVEGRGWVSCEHGRFPVPTMATLSIFAERGIVISQCEEPHELITPTGAALLSQFVDRFGLMKKLRPRKIGYGIGRRDLQSRPNVLRAVLGEIDELDEDDEFYEECEKDEVGVIECNLDDVSPEILGHAMEEAFRAGALDVFHIPVQMKKQRPGVLFTIICKGEETARFAKLMLLQTSSFGVRTSHFHRYKLRREGREVKTPFGNVAVQVGYLGDRAVRVSPEYEDCAQLSRRHGISIQQIIQSIPSILK